MEKKNVKVRILKYSRLNTFIKKYNVKRCNILVIKY